MKNFPAYSIIIQNTYKCTKVQGGIIMKKALLFVLAAVMVLTMFAGCTGGDKNTLTMATNAEFPPYEFMEDGKIVGIDAEIAQAIATKLGKELKIENVLSC